MRDNDDAIGRAELLDRGGERLLHKLLQRHVDGEDEVGATRGIHVGHVAKQVGATGDVAPDGILDELAAQIAVVAAFHARLPLDTVALDGADGPAGEAPVGVDAAVFRRRNQRADGLRLQGVGDLLGPLGRGAALHHDIARELCRIGLGPGREPGCVVALQLLQLSAHVGHADRLVIPHQVEGLGLIFHLSAAVVPLGVERLGDHLVGKEVSRIEGERGCEYTLRQLTTVAVEDGTARRLKAGLCFAPPVAALEELFGADDLDPIGAERHREEDEDQDEHRLVDALCYGLAHLRAPSL